MILVILISREITFETGAVNSFMDNPHAERQAVLLERIVKNSVRSTNTAYLSLI